MTAKPTLVFDTEVYRDYFLLALVNVETGNVRTFEMFEGRPLDVEPIRNIFQRYRVVSFNGINFDMPIISAALRGADCATLKVITDKIIVENMKHWQLGIESIRADHIDLIEVAPGVASLKIYGGRLHCPKMQDLPIEPDASISPAEREALKTYCVNDLATTLALYNHLKPQIELREKMSEVYGLDLRSKSDAQIAEAVIGKQVGTALGRNVQRPEVPPGTVFAYNPPPFLRFETDEMQALMTTIRRLDFKVPESGKVEMPVELEKAAIRLAGGVYRMGIGGLHSSEQTISHFSDDEHVLIDRDVASYYPMIILRTGLAPEHMGDAFTRSYRDLLEQRLKAKRAGNKVGADSLKIVVNGSFGKLGSKWSKLYSPNLMIQTTLTGQLSLLMLIERLEGAGIPVVSANTDGVVLKCPRAAVERADAIVAQWEKDTGFEMEATEYRALHSRDVNNYIAIKPDGKLKLKGAFAVEDLCPSPSLGLQKNPTNEVSITAAVEFLRNTTPVEETVLACRDVRRFVTIRQVKGGAVDQAGAYLGKAVRWYYAKGVEGPLTYKSNGYTVARSEGARALMQLPDAFPEDVDHDWYIREAHAILNDVGIDAVAYQVRDLI